MKYKPEITVSNNEIMSEGIPIAQSLRQIENLFSLIEEYGVKTFIELGVYLGGTASVMLKYKSQNADFNYYGFEIEPTEIRGWIRGRPEVTIIDVFSQDCQDIVRGKINETKGTAFVFCDDGNKSKEMLIYAPLLRTGDLLMAHDYPGEVSDEFLDGFGVEHPDYEEIWHTHFRAENGATLWRKK